jgi:2,3-dihydroxybiphenyl 1,2-dioxygenase
MDVVQLGYFGIGSSRVDDWRAFGSDFLGMQPVDVGAGHLALRMDDRSHRFLVHRSSRDGMAYFGFEVPEAAALERAAARLSNAGVGLTRGSTAEHDIRRVAGMIWFADPDGNRVELFHGAAPSETPFVPARPIGGFRTGTLGLGHVVLMTDDFETMQRFYLETLGFRLSDFVTAPFRGAFTHVNARHHSLAILEGPKKAFHHVMVEYNFLDDVGRLYDKALIEPERVSVTLGRHANDHMLSFYSRTPGGFMIETGWAGRLIDDATWKPHEVYGPSIWGHERSWLPPDARRQARALTDAAADLGVIEPLQVVDTPGFDLSPLIPRY